MGEGVGEADGWGVHYSHWVYWRSGDSSSTACAVPLSRCGSVTLRFTSRYCAYGVNGGYGIRHYYGVQYYIAGASNFWVHILYLHCLILFPPSDMALFVRKIGRANDIFCYPYPVRKTHFYQLSFIHARGCVPGCDFSIARCIIGYGFLFNNILSFDNWFLTVCVV